MCDNASKSITRTKAFRGAATYNQLKNINWDILAGSVIELRPVPGTRIPGYPTDESGTRFRFAGSITRIGNFMTR